MFSKSDTEKSMQLTEESKQRLYDKTAGICIICHKKISRHPEKWSVEHFIPRAIYKWVPSRNLKIILESSENLFIVHFHCNLKKDSALPSIKQITQLGVEDEIKDQIFRIYNFVEKEIMDYRAIKQQILTAQQEKCAFCDKPINMHTATLRRRDNKQPRVVENAMCLCVRCNRATDTKKRKKQLAESAEKSGDS